MKKLIKASSSRGIDIRDLDNIPHMFHRLGLYDYYDIDDSSSNILESNRQIIELLKSKGFDSVSKIKALLYAWNSGLDPKKLIDDGFYGTASDLKRLAKKIRNEKDLKIKENLDSRYGKYWDESQSAYVLNEGDSKKLVQEIEYLLSSLYDSPTFKRKYITSGRYYKLFVHW